MGIERTLGHLSKVSVEPEIRRLHSPDIYNLAEHSPQDSAYFGFLLQIMVGPVGQQGEESFDAVVCTPRWIADHLGSDGILVGRHHLLVDRYDFRRLEEFLRQYVARCSGATWEEAATRIGRLAKWEFEDYAQKRS
jgi:hypothetical protein